MPALLWITRATCLVPGWCWAIVVGVLAAMCLALDSGRSGARADAELARSQLLQVQLASARAIGAEKDRAAARVRDLTQALVESQDALSQARQAAPGRIAALDQRLQQHARPVACRGAAGAPSASAVASDAHGQPGAGFRGLAGQDLVLLDGQARYELAELVVSARGVGETLTEVRGLLRECWRSEAAPVTQ